MIFDVRKAFYAAVCFVTLGLSAWGAYTILSVVLRSTLLTQADQYYMDPVSGDEVKSESRQEARRKNAVARRQAEFAEALPVLIINLPMFLLFYQKVKEKDLTEKK